MVAKYDPVRLSNRLSAQPGAVLLRFERMAEIMLGLHSGKSQSQYGRCGCGRPSDAGGEHCPMAGA